MKRLIITAHPSSTWFTHKIAKSYKEGAESIWDKAEIVNLYDKKYYQDFLAFEDIKNIKEDIVRDTIQEKISKSDELIFVFPIWWWWFPAILKNFFDVNLSSWFAFKYLKWWKVEKLLSGKKAKVFATCDAPWFIYKLFIFPLRVKWYLSMYILGFCWIKITNFLLFDSMWKSKWDESKREKMLKKVYNLALLK